MIFGLFAFEGCKQCRWVTSKATSIDFQLALLADKDASKSWSIVTFQPNNRSVRVIEADSAIASVLSVRGWLDSRWGDLVPTHRQMNHVQSVRSTIANGTPGEGIKISPASVKLFVVIEQRRLVAESIPIHAFGNSLLGETSRPARSRIVLRNYPVKRFRFAGKSP